MITALWHFKGGIKTAGHKTLSSETPIVQATIPAYLILPLLQHIGIPTEPIVHVGERVLKGQIIGRCCQNDNYDAFFSAPIHASTSGTVVAIESRPVPHPSGLTAACVIIKTDGLDEAIAFHPLANYASIEPATVRRHIAQAGIVGLGGAGFPSHLKLKPQGVETLILNGAECEPYITCDDRLMREHPAEVIGGALILRHVLGGAKRCIIAIEDNKPIAFKTLQQAAQGTDIEVIQIPSLYPTGGERQLIKVLTNKEVERSQLPAHVGIVVHNVETARAIYQAVTYGKPLISRVITVTGNGVTTPQNIEVRFGTLMRDLLAQCHVKPDICRLIMGGSMMGFTLPSDELPIIKTTNCLIASCADDILQPELPMPCIRCGACANSCPVNLLPQQLYWHAKAKAFDKARELHLFDCIECGCCAYVCPSHIPLVDYYRYAKAEIREAEQAKHKADTARQRHEARLERLEREKAAKAAKHQQKKILPDKVETNTDNAQASKQAVIAAALERAKTKQATNTPNQDLPE
ncbi:electron transport complex subunit RsxC [Beggiatoa leptomitoformis]|uniref:Ion-translocating oxidoreductase complex subunit C n=1 Tax=Beggiatoa leptomitoformis TaxID=288004 RepID=A0A2N9YCL3_9GAMM|nr:electron transport complex subunit RsxC [Beggiatoa leptomitoformis]ALG66539.1 electron transport complex subunit RsxC [Beggiatoa leptomitoformis]AUI68164.1 electron transport complex subunit RsxC [Beggiatoa leptomitoformis]